MNTVCFRAPSLVAILGLLAAGCQQGVEVTVTQTPQGVTFAIDDDDGERCLDSVTVYPSVPADAEPLWESRKDLRDKGCIARIVYGDAPAGFGRQATAAPLERGQAYRVMVGGVGFLGSAEFTRE